MLNIKRELTSDEDYFILPVLHQSLVSPTPVPISQEAPQPHMVVHLQLLGVVVSESATSCDPENHLKSMFRSDNSLVSSSRVKGHAAKIF